ncbi:MAG: CRISPR-associated endoribonuclease Cas6 [Candidatus Thorarchaeota archaeon]|nr:CRISPR-associated endoribonuclease Cas6 [Candidatus Thorarchaeota archaeon]
MRFRVTLAPMRISRSHHPPVIRYDYQHAVGSMFYDRLIRARSEYKELHDGKGFKYFTFSGLEIPKRRALRNGLEILSNDTYLWFSSVDGTLVRILAGQMLREPAVRIAGVDFRVVEAMLMPGLELHGSSQTFTTMSPIIIRKRIEQNGRVKTWDLSPNDPDFVERLKRNLVRKFTEYTGRVPDGTIEVAKIERTKQKRIEIQEIYHRAHLMDVTLEGNPQLVAFAYDCGLGEKNSMGFGMVQIS